MALSAGSVAHKTTVLGDPVDLRATEWKETTIICGALGLLLSLYEQSPNVEVSLHHSEESVAHTFSVEISCNRSATAIEYLAGVASLLTSTAEGADPSFFTPASLRQKQNSEALTASLVFLEVKAVLEQEKPGSPLSSIWFRYRFDNSKPHLSAVFGKDDHDEEFVKRLLHQLSHLAEQLSQSSSSLRDVNLLDKADAQDIRRWNPVPALPTPSCVYQVVEKNVFNSPSAPAVHAWDGKLTYRELHNLSFNVAGQLSSLGAPSGSVIPLLFEKSLWTVVAMMAVVRAGHAFLLLDTSHPPGRLEMLTGQVKGPVIMASESQKDRALLLAPQVIVVSPTTSKKTPDPFWDEGTSAEKPQDVALVVFTSGTTGRPKATAIEHHSVCSGLIGLAQRIRLPETCRFYQFSSYAWDAAFGEMLMTLFRGGCICIPSEADRMNQLAQSITSMEADSILLTPTVLRLLSPQEVPTLRNVIMGGEKVTRGLVRTWASLVNLMTVYAPAECTVACMVNQQFDEQSDPALIGTAFGCRTWITLADNIDQLAPVGVTGELLIEGPNVARGYLNDAQKTAESFLEASPRWMTELQLDRIVPSRFYRTGDLVRYTPDGTIVFVGRRDFQVKLRGQRIELEEIQAQIQKRLQLPGAQVFVDVISGSRQSLAAFVHLPHGDRGCFESGPLRVALLEVLPDYMVPTLWIPLVTVPLSSSGKLDRRALSRLGGEYLAGLQATSQKAEGLTETQQQLSQLWSKVLSTRSPGLANDFFLLGGDSVKAMQLVSLAHREKLRLSVKDIFQHPTLSAMSSTIERRTKPESEPSRFSPFSMLSSEDLAKSFSFFAKLGFKEQEIADVFPCTQLQEGMFTSSLSVPGSYVSQYVFSFHPTMTEKVARAWEQTVAAIPILRARILPSLTGFNQAVVKEPLRWTSGQQSLPSYLEFDQQKLFNIGEPLARYCLVEDPLSSEVHLVWSLHHAIFDGWSIEGILGYVRDHVEGEPISGELNGDFSRFVEFSHQVDQEDARTFWREQLHGAPVPSFPAVPTEKKIPVADRSCFTHHVDACRFSKPGTTITVLARGALAILLSHYEMSENVIFGNTVHGRNSLPPELQNVVGPTLATLPVRVRVDRRQKVSQFLSDLQEKFVTTMPYEQYGLLRIRDIDNHTRLSSSFRALLIVQNTDSVPSIGSGIQGREAFKCLHEYPLVITIIPESTRVKMSWTYDETLLSEDQVQALALQFDQALAQLTSSPEPTRICDLDLASRSDKDRFYDWNAQHHKAVETSALELLYGQIQRDPEAVAVDAWDGTLTYRSLDKLSSIFATELVRLGVVQNQLVGHCFEKTVWAPVALLAIVKAGGAFAPFSPGYPRERLLTFTRDAQIKIILCSDKQLESLSGGPWKILVVNLEGSNSPFTDPGVLPLSVSPESLIYALQTSGTTGEPKTFTVKHTAFVTGAITREFLIERGSGKRVLQFGLYTFRLAIENILTTLTAGGCLCIPSDSAMMDDLSGYMQEAKVNFANVTPSVARTLEPDRIPSLKVLLVSGEPPDRDLIATWAGRVHLINGYGPSEFTAKQTLNFNMTQDDPQNLGRAVGSSLWVVDPENHERLSPLGAIGELLIEGPTLADGYIKRPSETTKRFISTPAWLREFREMPTTVFKTGDLMRYNTDGTLTSIGRADGQVKLHGQRFEAKEVEHHIRKFFPDEQIDVLVDVVRFQGQESDVAAAFLSSKEHKLQNTLELNAALSEQIQSEKERIVEYLSCFLPRYMVPSIFFGVSMIPVTANGKVDRRGLKAFSSQLPINNAGAKDDVKVTRLPRSYEEKTLHSLWQKVLGLEGDRFGVDHHFLELGGSSMAAIRLVSMAREAQASLTVQAILTYPVLRDMSLQVKRIDTNTSLTSVPAFSLLEEIGRSEDQLKAALSVHGIAETSVEDAYPLLALQSYYMKKAVTFPASTSWEHVYELPNNIDLDRLESALEFVWKANASLRTRVVSISGRFVQVVCNEGFVCRRLTRLKSCFEQDQGSGWALGDPLSRFSIVVDEQNGSHLVWSTNHVVWDGWSRTLIFQDIDYAYQHGSLPLVRPSYKDFIAHICRHSSPKRLPDSSLLKQEYIGRQFTPLSRTHWAEHVVQNSKRMTMAVNLPVPKELAVSRTSLLLTAWTLTVAIVEESNSVLTANEVSDRESSFPGIENLAEPAVAAIPLCVGLEPRTIREHAALVQRHTIEAISIEHAVDWDEQLLSQMETSAYWILINDEDESEEPPTESMQLRRSRAEKIGVGMWPFHLTFNVHAESRCVELQALFNVDMVAVEKAVKLFACLKFILHSALGSGGLDLNTMDLKSAVNDQLQGDGGIVEEVEANSSIEPWFYGPRYNPYV